MAFLLARAFGGARAPAGSGDAGAFDKLPVFGIDTEDAGFWRSMSADTAKESHTLKQFEAGPWERQLSEGRSGTGTFTRQISEGAYEQSPAPRGRCFSDSIVCKGLNPAGNSEALQRCGSKEFPDPGGMGKNDARVEALRRAEMLARFDHSYDGRRR